MIYILSLITLIAIIQAYRSYPELDIDCAPFMPFHLKPSLLSWLEDGIHSLPLMKMAVRKK